MNQGFSWAASCAAFCVCLCPSLQAEYTVCEPHSASIAVTAFVEYPLGFTTPESGEQVVDSAVFDGPRGALLWLRYARRDGVVVSVDDPRVPVTRASELKIAGRPWPGIDVLASEGDRSLVRIGTSALDNDRMTVTITVISTDN